MNHRDQHMVKLHQSGKISDEALLLYGIAGNLPAIEEYWSLSRRDQMRFWSARLNARLGKYWAKLLPSLEVVQSDWKKQGF